MKHNQSQKKRNTVVIPSSIRVKDLAQILHLPVTRLIKELMQNNIFATINEEIDHETATIIAQDLGFKTRKQAPQEDSFKKTEKDIVLKDNLAKIKIASRPPVVTVMGHVDHGKTTLLDYIRKSDTAKHEAGGITQNIGAYQIKQKGKTITFLDTPGHEAFVTMRERGSHLTDIAILVIAADDGVKPQTREAIAHIQKAKIPMIVAINKIDKPGAKPEQIKAELAKEGIHVEKWGGDIPVQEISAKTGKGVKHLLEIILLVAEMENLKAPPKEPVLGTVIESHLSPQRGPEATILVQSGSLKLGDYISVPGASGKIKRIEDYLGKTISQAGPSTPVKITGFSAVPAIGSILQTIKEKTAQGQETISASEEKSLKIINDRALNPKVKKLNLILKTDSHGSKEAILENLSKIESSEVAPRIIYEGIGNITESDVLKSHITQAILIGFNIEATKTARELAKQIGVQIHRYDVIYELIEHIKKGLEELLKPQIQVVEKGKLKVLAIFRTEKERMIIGGKVTQGKIQQNSKVRVKRGDQVIGRGELLELQTGKQKVEEVKAGQEAGIKFSGDVRIKEGDLLEFYKIAKKKQTL